MKSKHMWAMSGNDGPMFDTISVNADDAVAIVAKRIGPANDLPEYERLHDIGFRLVRVKLTIATTHAVEDLTDKL